MRLAKSIHSPASGEDRLHAPAQRQGAALVVVLVVIVLLSLSAYTFTELMLAEVEATERYGRGALSQAFADSGVELAAAWLFEVPEEEPHDLYHNPELFQSVLLQDSTVERGRGRVSLVAPVESDLSGKQIRFGLIDESARLNPNALIGFGLDEELTREMLMYLPDMTEEIADAILDWVDADDDPRTYGAESDVYLTFSPPYEAKNGPLESVDELLLVAGVTPELLYGEDANRNGLLDPNENDGEATPPFDNADGVLNPGWAEFLTVHSRESNLRPDGTPKININQPLLTVLYDELAEEFGEDSGIPQFITAYRLNGSDNVPPLYPEGSENTTGDIETDEALQNVAKSLARSFASGGDEIVTRGGMDITAGPSYDFVSLYDLIDAEVTVQVQEGSVTVPGISTLASPWTSAPGDLAESLPVIFENFTIRDAQIIEGRININQARLECLLGLPDMPPDLAEAIVAAAPQFVEGQPTSDVLSYRTTTGWLLIEGMTDLTTMRLLDRYLTVRGSVYRANAVGHFDRGGPVARVEAVIDSTFTPPRVVFQRDLSHLGPGYRIDQLSHSFVE
ncbi:MAG: general secretion pathway protein GspK [Planctomycetaceae bacterium]|nr:general secretion pathway protein GspK [Planctomycetaceae bacterium]